VDIIHLFALIGGALNVYAFWRYNREVFVGKTVPNGTTWSLWALVTIAQATSYHAMKVDWTMLVVMASDTTLCTVTFLLMLFKGKFDRLSKSDWIVACLSIAAVILWKTTSAVNGNLMAQIPYALAFLPIICFTWTHRMDFVSSVVAIVMHGIETYYAFRGRKLYATPLSSTGYMPN
jgi:hypothetical protein